MTYEVVYRRATLETARLDLRRVRPARRQSEAEEILIFSLPAIHRWRTTTCPAWSVAADFAAPRSRRSRRRYTYRFLFIPGTIGAIRLARVQRKTSSNGSGPGLVLACVGDPEPVVFYKRSRRGQAPPLDRVAAHVLVSTAPVVTK